MKPIFDSPVIRKDTGSVKWDFVKADGGLLPWNKTDIRGEAQRILALGVADMDFASPQPVVDAILERATRGIYGYTYPMDTYYDAVIRWMRRRHDWTVRRDWICHATGVVPALNMLVRTYISPGDKVVIQSPVYYPFFNAILNNGGEVVANPLRFEEGTYRMDFADLEEKTADPKVNLAILCSPHNPVGRVWTRAELQRFGEICLKNDVLVISDEIHGDLVYSGVTFTPFSAVNPDFPPRTITCTAPSKTFNLAGLQTSNIIIPDPRLRAQYRQTLKSNGMFGINVFGAVALEAAYNHGEAWLGELMAYLEDNRDFVVSYVARHIPRIDVIRPEGTFLIWMDCRRLGLSAPDLRKLMLEKAGVNLEHGYAFGPEGEGFERMNIGCPRGILTEALGRIRHAVESLSG